MPDSDDFLIAFAALPWESPVPGLRVKQVCRGGQRIRLIEMGAAFTEADWCLKGHVGYLLKGTLEIDFGGRLVKFGTGDAFVIPPGEDAKHKAAAPDGTALLFVVEPADAPPETALQGEDEC